MRCNTPWDSHLSRRPLLLLSALLLLTLTACSLLSGRDADPTAQPTLAFATVTLTPEPTPEPTETPRPTAIAPRAEIDDQTLAEDGELTAARVALPGPGWLVIFSDDDGQPGEVLGQTPLAGGVHDDVSVTVDPLAATSTLHARLHLDAGAEGVFEFPGEDEAYPGEPGTTFEVESQLPRPVVEAADQPVGEDNLVTLARVELLEPGWALIHADEDGQAGAVIGRIRLEAGVHENVSLTIDRRWATPTLYAVLHEDDGETGLLEYPEGDLPLLVNGEAVVAPFAAVYPPDILVYDQPIVDGAVVINRVISNGPGWVAVYFDQDGQPGLIIGSAPLVDGLNENVRVELIESAATPLLYARLHQDTEPGDDFNYPAADPVVLYEERMPRAAAFRTDNGAQAIVHDQPVVDDGVTVQLVITPVNTWVAIHADSDGQAGIQLGRTFVPAGVNHHIVVFLDPPPTGEAILHLVLYQDLGEPETFEALGTDPMLANANGRVIRIPFAVTAE